MGLRSLVVYGPLAAAGVPPELLLWHPLAVLALGPLAHANVGVPVSPFWHRLLVTPGEHREHHARDLSDGDANFAVVTPLWDVAFGTFRDPTGRPPPDVGIADDPLPATFWGQALSPLCWRRLAPGPGDETS